MNATEKVVLRELIDRIRKDGRTILLIEHDVKLVMGLCDRVTVLDYGKQIAEGTPADVQREREGDRGLPRRRPHGALSDAMAQRHLLKVSGLKVAYGGIQAVKGVELRGPRGRAGQPDRRQRRRQDHHAEGHHRHQPVGRRRDRVHGPSRSRARAPWDLVKQGLVMVPEGRGVFTRMTITENLQMGAFVRDDKRDRRRHRQGVRASSRA